MSRTIPLDVDTDELERLLRSTAKDVARLAAIVDELLASAIEIESVVSRQNYAYPYHDKQAHLRLRAAIARAEGGKP